MGVALRNIVDVQTATRRRRMRGGSQLSLPIYLGLKEVWRNKGRFALVASVIALITILVLFIAALAEGLGAGNKEYIEKLNADLLVYQDKVDLSIPSSRIDQAKVRSLRRVPGVAEVGPIGFSNASIPTQDVDKPLKISLIGVVPGLPGEPVVLAGRGLERVDVNEAIIDSNVAEQAGFGVGDMVTIKTIQGTDEEFFDVLVVGVTDGQKYSIQPSVMLPYKTWDKIRPQERVADEPREVIFNVVAVRLDDPTQRDTMAEHLQRDVRNIQAVDLKTAYENTPGYSAQQSTLSTQRIFSLLIGVLVIGGFFQIQTLQKVAQIGMLKAIGASNRTIALAFVLQIVAVTIFGVGLGALGTLLLALSLPSAIPLAFTAEPVIAAIMSLLLIGPIGGLVSVRSLLKVEPLTALGLSG